MKSESEADKAESYFETIKIIGYNNGNEGVDFEIVKISRPHPLSRL